VAPPDDIYDDIPSRAFAETANGFLTGSYIGIDTPQLVELDDVVEAQETGHHCVEMTKVVARGEAKASFRNCRHALYR